MLELKLVFGDQEYELYVPLPPDGLADKVAELPLQIGLALAVGAADGSGFTVMVPVEVTAAQGASPVVVTV